jgi:hypothetical protein
MELSSNARQRVIILPFSKLSDSYSLNDRNLRGAEIQQNTNTAHEGAVSGQVQPTRLREDPLL